VLLGWLGWLVVGIRGAWEPASVLLGWLGWLVVGIRGAWEPASALLVALAVLGSVRGCCDAPGPAEVLGGRFSVGVD
jgi:hypothetical protein